MYVPGCMIVYASSRDYHTFRFLPSNLANLVLFRPPRFLIPALALRIKVRYISPLA